MHIFEESFKEMSMLFSALHVRLNISEVFYRAD